MKAAKRLIVVILAIHSKEEVHRLVMKGHGQAHNLHVLKVHTILRVQCGHNTDIGQLELRRFNTLHLKVKIISIVVLNSQLVCNYIYVSLSFFLYIFVLLLCGNTVLFKFRVDCNTPYPNVKHGNLVTQVSGTIYAGATLVFAC